MQWSDLAPPSIMLEVIEVGALYLAIATMLEAGARMEAHQAIDTLEANRSHILLVRGAWPQDHLLSDLYLTRRLLRADGIVFQCLVGHQETLTDPLDTFRKALGEQG